MNLGVVLRILSPVPWHWDKLQLFSWVVHLLETKNISAGCKRRQGVQHSLGAQLWGSGAWACVRGQLKYLWLQVELML